MSHSCVSNAKYVNLDNGNFEVYANIEIKRGDQITDFYTSPLKGAKIRRKILRNSFFFDCFCQRCENPVCDVDSVKCPDCPGISKLQNPTLQNSDYECEKCAKILKCEEIEILEEKFANLIEKVDKTNSKEILRLIETLLNSLNENHYLILETKRFYIYSGSPVNSIKRNFSFDILRVYNEIVPGYSKERGLTLYEAASSDLDVNLNQVEDKIPLLATTKERLSECLECLRHEKGEFEREIFKLAGKKFKEIQEFENLLKIMNKI